MRPEVNFTQTQGFGSTILSARRQRRKGNRARWERKASHWCRAVRRRRLEGDTIWKRDRVRREQRSQERRRRRRVLKERRGDRAAGRAGRPQMRFRRSRLRSRRWGGTIFFRRRTRKRRRRC